MLIVLASLVEGFSNAMHKEHIQITITIIYSEHIVSCFQNFADVRISLCPSYDYITIQEEILYVFFSSLI